MVPKNTAFALGKTSNTPREGKYSFHNACWGFHLHFGFALHALLLLPRVHGSGNIEQIDRFSANKLQRTASMISDLGSCCHAKWPQDLFRVSFELWCVSGEKFQSLAMMLLSGNLLPHMHMYRKSRWIRSHFTPRLRSKICHASDILEGSQRGREFAIKFQWEKIWKSIF